MTGSSRSFFHARPSLLVQARRPVEREPERAL
jgi:hypothetical protein